MLKAFILSLIVLTPNHELNKDPEQLEHVAGYFAGAGARYDIEPSLVAYWAYRESSLRVDLVGSLGEVGYAQAHGQARRTCVAAGFDVESRRGGAYCIALLLDMGRRRCGSLQRGAVWVASGNCKGSLRTREKIKSRLNGWQTRWEKSQRSWRGQNGKKVFGIYFEVFLLANDINRYAVRAIDLEGKLPDKVVYCEGETEMASLLKGIRETYLGNPVP